MAEICIFFRFYSFFGFMRIDFGRRLGIRQIKLKKYADFDRKMGKLAI